MRRQVVFLFSVIALVSLFASCGGSGLKVKEGGPAGTPGVLPGSLPSVKHTVNGLGSGFTAMGSENFKGTASLGAQGSGGGTDSFNGIELSIAVGERTK